MNIVTKIVTFPFTLIRLSLKRVLYLLEIKHKLHTVYILIIMIHWIYGYAFITGKAFYEDYTKVASANVERTIESTARQDEIELQPGTEAWIKEQWQTRTNAKWENIYAVIQGESGWNSDAWNCNNNGSLDLGLYQGNTIHKELTPSCALNTVCATNWAIELYNEQGLTPWVAAKKLGLTK